MTDLASGECRFGGLTSGDSSQVTRASFQEWAGSMYDRTLSGFSILALPGVRHSRSFVYTFKSMRAATA